MSPLLYIPLSLRALAANKLRSGLAMLGVIIGVMAVISIVSLGQAASQMVQNQIASLGANQVFIMPGSAKTGGFHGGMGSVKTLLEADYEAIMRECPSILVATPAVTSRVTVIRGNQNWSTAVQGTNETFLAIRDWSVDTGRFFTASDARSGSKVCVLGKTVAQNLFGNANPVGETIRIRQFPFTVVGVLAAKGQTPWGMDFDDLIVAPFKTVQKKLLAIDHLHFIQASAAADESMEQACEEVATLLRRRHHIQDPDDDDFMIRNQQEIAKAADTAGQILTMLLGSIAAVSLLVGGVGVMNIMLVSVTERTREIGIRMAIGARARDILSQFLAEAICLTGTGGLLGILGAYLAALAFQSFFPWPISIARWAAVLSFVFSAIIGITFGLYPAWRASRMDPVEALRN